MVLCDACRRIDVRGMTIYAYSCSRSKSCRDESIEREITRGIIRLDEYPKPGEGHCIMRWRNSYAAVKTSSANGCEFCRLIWQTYVGKYNGEIPNIDFDSESDEEDTPPGFTLESHIGGGSGPWEPPKLRVALALKRYQRRLRGWSCYLEAFASRDNVPPSGQALLYTDIHSDPAETSCLDQALQWLHTCSANHPTCAWLKRRRVRAPTRLIDVGLPDGSEQPRLCLSNENITSWVALSYCWGGPSEFMLTEQTMEYLIRGVPLFNFPATLRDAVTITRALNIKHLWIDAICIKQDDRSDWLRECGRMRDVYKDATVTVIASDSASSNAGIFAKRIQSEPLPFPWYSSDGSQVSVQEHTVYLRDAAWKSAGDLSSQIQRRGWTLQEDLLSPRTLSYLKTRMVWECPTLQTDEGGRVSVPPNYDGGKIFTTADIDASSERDLNYLWLLYRRWAAVIEDYTFRRLTVETDRLPGLSGLASEFARRAKDTYCAGLWRRELLYGLAWCLHERKELEGDRKVAVSAEYRAPSWSWASINGFGVESFSWEAFTSKREKLHEMAETIEVHVEPVLSGDQFGPVRAAHIILQAHFWPIQNPVENVRAPPNQTMSAVQKVLEVAILTRQGMKREFHQQHKPCDCQQFALLKLFGWSVEGDGGYYLILESTTPEASAYRRIGFLDIWDTSYFDDKSYTYPHYKEIFNDLELFKNACRELQAVKTTKKQVKII